jgi:hypothetical protein
MRYSDKFPPNAFLKKHLFDRPWRFLIGIFVYMAFVIFGGKYFPYTMMTISLGALAIILPSVLIIMVWQVVWYIKNPPPPPKVCPCCGHRDYDSHE